MKYLVLLLLITPLTLAHSQISKKEKKLVAWIDEHQEAAITLLETSVNINSGTLNLDGVRSVGDLFRAELDALGLETTWVDGSEVGRAGHLIAKTPGEVRGKKKILLIGHLDTVFEQDSPFQKYRVVNDSMATGPGITDMKGGDVIMIYILKALHANHLLDQVNVRLIMTGDEERSGKPLEISRKSLIELAKWADVAIGFEDGDGDPSTANISRRGAVSWKLSVNGNPAHSSQVFSESVGAGAIYEMARILNSFYSEMKDQDLLTFNPGMVMGGTTVDYDPATAEASVFGKSNIVAEYCQVIGDLRTINQTQFDWAKATMQEIVSRNLPGTESSLTFAEGYPPLAPSEGNMELLELLDEISRDLGQGGVSPVNPLNAGAADISFTAPYVDMAIDGLGLGGHYGHTVDEVGNLNTYSKQAKRALLLITRLSK